MRKTDRKGLGQRDLVALAPTGAARDETCRRDQKTVSDETEVVGECLGEVPKSKSERCRHDRGDRNGEQRAALRRRPESTRIAERSDAFGREARDVVSEHEDRGCECSQVQHDDERQGVLADAEEMSANRNVTAARNWKKLGETLQCSQCCCRQRVDFVGQGRKAIAVDGSPGKERGASLGARAIAVWRVFD